MKVLHVLNTGKLSGAENVAADICMMFKDEFEMAYCSPDGPIRAALADRGIAFFPIDRLSVSELKRVIARYQPDLIDAHDVRATVATALGARSIPFISHLHVNNDDMRKITIKSILYLLAAKKANKIIAVSQSCIDEYVFRKSVEKKTLVLKNVIYSKRLEILIKKSNQEYAPDFIFLGRLTDQKDPKRIAKVAAEVLKHLPEAKFGVIGDGELRAEMKAIFTNEGVADRVIFTGSLSYPYKIIAQSKCMLFCSKFEGTPISALEAMYFGVAIVSTPTDGLIELIDNNVTGYLSDDNEVLVLDIVRLIQNETLRKAMSKKQIEKFKQINDEVAYAKTLEKVYRTTGQLSH